MTRRTQAMYVAVLTRLHERSAELYEIDLEPRIITTDFEKGAINAFQEVFPHVTVSGCHFHLSQSVLRKVNELGLKTTYEGDAEFALHIRMLMALAFVPTDDVPAAFDIVCNSMPDTCKPVAEYFDSTYVRGSVGRRNRHRPPQFPPNIWNASERFAATLPTTNNHVEAWHNRLQTLIVVDHPSFYSCLHKLRQEQRHTEVQVLRLQNGFRKKSRRRSVCEQHKRMTTLIG